MGPVLPDVLLQDCLCGRTHPGFQFRVSVYVGPDEDLKNKFRKSGSPTWFPLWSCRSRSCCQSAAAAGVSSSVRTLPEPSEPSFKPDVLLLNPAFSHFPGFFFPSLKPGKVNSSEDSPSSCSFGAFRPRFPLDPGPCHCTGWTPSLTSSVPVKQDSFYDH